MQESNLSLLRDIHLPLPIHPWWPLADGYIAIGLLSIIGIILYGIWLLLRYKKNQPKRHALKLLEQIKKAYMMQQNPALTALQVNTLLKRVALAYHPRQYVAELHGQSWINFLNKSSQHLDFCTFQLFFTTYPYQKRIDPLPPAYVQTFFEHIRKWIIQQPQGHV